MFLLPVLISNVSLHALTLAQSRMSTTVECKTMLQFDRYTEVYNNTKQTLWKQNY